MKVHTCSSGVFYTLEAPYLSLFFYISLIFTEVLFLFLKFILHIFITR